MRAVQTFHRTRKEKEACEVEERQALLPADKPTLTGETTEALPAIDIRQYHGGKARSATLLSDNSDISESLMSVSCLAFRFGIRFQDRQLIKDRLIG